MNDRFGLALALGLWLAPGAAAGQTASVSAPLNATAPPAGVAAPAFDVASVRPSEQLDPQKMMAAMRAGKMPRLGAHVEGLRAEYAQMTLKDLIANAYEVKTYQVSGPDFLNTQRFDIVANMPDGSTADDAPKMLRALLEDRFKLEAQEKTEDHPVLALVVSKGGAKLKESAEKPVAIDPNAELQPGEMKLDGPQGLMIIQQNPDGSITANMGEQGRFVQRMDPQSMMMHMEGSAISMQGLAEMLTQVMMAGGAASGREVVDLTGMKGYYDVTLDLSVAELMRMAAATAGLGGPGGGGGGGGSTGMAEASDPGGGASLFDSVEKMGLKLDSRKAPVEQVVVTHVERMPTAN